MHLLPDTLLDVCDQIAGGLRQSHQKPHAIIIRKSNELLCFVLRKEGDYHPMTQQGLTEDEPLVFTADEHTFVKKCLPDVLRKIFHTDSVTIALVDTMASYQCDQLLDMWVSHQNERQHTPRLVDVTLQAFQSDCTQTFVEVAHRKLLRSQTERKPLTKEAYCEPKFIYPALSITSGDVQIPLNEIEDLPAGFSRFVWQACDNAPASRYTGEEAWCHLYRSEKSLTTLEVARRMHRQPSVHNIISTYKQLRAVEGEFVVVPMIAFEREWLTAASYLTTYSSLDKDDLGLEDLRVMHFQRYKIIPAKSRKVTNERLMLSAARCLAGASDGLRLLDLTEDVIYDLTGKIGIILSLADVCRARDAVTNYPDAFSA